MDPIAQFCRHAATSDFERMPADAVAATKVFLLDSLGVGIAGSSGAWTEQLQANLRKWAGAGDCRLLGRSERLPGWAAAMANAYHIHNSEFDCVHEGAVVHAMAAVLGASLGEVETQGGISGEALLNAVAVGVNVAAGIGVGSKAPLKFFRPGTAGAFGAAAAVGKLRGFDTDRLINAMGVAHAQLCGTMQAHVEGSMVLALQIGFNARNAVMACDMAELGLVAPADVLAGQFGFYPLFEGDYDLDDVLDDLDRIWRITEVAHKPFPSGRATHGILDGVLDIRRTENLAATDVAAVTAQVTPLTYRLIGRPIRPEMTSNYARLCGQYVVARAVLRGHVDMDDFQPEALFDGPSHALAAKIEIIEEPSDDPNALTPVAVQIICSDGRRFSRQLDQIYGNPAKPMPRAAQLEKFAKNWRYAAAPLVPENEARVIDLIDRLETVADCREILDLCSG